MSTYIKGDKILPGLKFGSNYMVKKAKNATIQDVQDGSVFIELSADQVSFWQSNRNASVLEIFNMELFPAVEPEEPVKQIPIEEQMITVVRMMASGIDVSVLTDEQALSVPDINYSWGHYLNKSMQAKTRFTYNGKLWKAVIDIDVVLENQKPGEKGMSALYAIVTVPSADLGTLRSPIPYGNNMELMKDIYYADGDDVYLCIQYLASTNNWSANSLSQFLQKV